MPTIAAMCAAAKLDRPAYNALMVSGRASSWGEVGSEGFAVRLGFFAAFKATGFLVPAAVDYADTLASQAKLPKWYVRNALDNSERFISSDNFEQMTIGSLLGLADDDEGELVDEDEPPRLSFAPQSVALVVINLHSVRARMLALFK